jgi:hypothetical protein
MFENTIRKFKKGYAEGVSQAKRFLGDDSAQAAPMAMLTAVLGAAIMLGIVVVVMVLMPSIAGDVITAINVSEDNAFYNLTMDAPTKAASSFSLLWVAALVAVVVIIIGGIAGLAFIFMRGRQ